MFTQQVALKSSSSSIIIVAFLLTNVSMYYFLQGDNYGRNTLTPNFLDDARSVHSLADDIFFPGTAASHGRSAQAGHSHSKTLSRYTICTSELIPGFLEQLYCLSLSLIQFTLGCSDSEQKPCSKCENDFNYREKGLKMDPCRRSKFSVQIIL